MARSLSVIFIGVTLNSHAQVDTFRHKNHVSSPYRSDFSSILKLEFKAHDTLIKISVTTSGGHWLLTAQINE